MVVGVNFPAALIALYAAITLTPRVRRILDLARQGAGARRNGNFRAKALDGLIRLERFAAKHRIRLPIHGILRRLGTSA